MPQAVSKYGLYRVSQKELTKLGANFTLEGLRFHSERLETFTNPKGGGLDKIPMNTISYVQLHRQQFEPLTPRIIDPLDEWEAIQPKPEKKPIFLRKKAQYHVANHLLGIGKVAYWTGSTGRSTLLGLDIDDHDSESPEAIKMNSTEALNLFTELTGRHPVSCPSRRGIHGFLILDRGWLTAQATNELWHNVVRLVQAEGKRRGLKAQLECKGKARIINDLVEYGGVLLKDPFAGMNPTDNDLHIFWATLEERRLSDKQLQDMLTTLATLNHEIVSASVASSFESLPVDEIALAAPSSDISSTESGKWVKNCHFWATHGLHEHDSMAEAVFALAKWLYFVELWDSDENERFEQVINILQHFCLHKHNGYITRLNNNNLDEVLSHVKRIVRSATGVTQSAHTCFARIRAKRSSGQYTDMWFLAPLLLSSSVSSSPVKLTVCCSVLKMEEREYRNPKEWVFVPDNTPIPVTLEKLIREGLKARKAKEKSYRRIVALLNHILNEGGETRIGVVAQKKMGFSNHAARQHIVMLREMGIILIKDDYSPVLKVAKTFVLTARTKEAFGMPVYDPDVDTSEAGMPKDAV